MAEFGWIFLIFDSVSKSWSLNFAFNAFSSQTGDWPCINVLKDHNIFFERKKRETSVNQSKKVNWNATFVMVDSYYLQQKTF